jgi:flagellar biosynthesis anti-sigma factor FlgM
MKIDANWPVGGNDPADNVSSNKAASRPVNSYLSGSGSADTAPTGTTDTVSLSNTVAQIQKLQAQLGQVPEVRTARVTALQQQISQGTYRPSNSQIASAVYDELSGNSGAGASS